MLSVCPRHTRLVCLLVLSVCPHHTYVVCLSSPQVSKEAKDGELFAMYNRTVSSHHRPRQFAERLCVLVRNISESVPIRTLSFLIDACQLLVECHKVRGAVFFLSNLFSSSPLLSLSPLHLLHFSLLVVYLLPFLPLSLLTFTLSTDTFA